MWFALTLGLAAFYPALALRKAYEFPHTIPLDARVHVFWMQRFVDPALFPHDLIADYVQSVSPPGFAALYRVLAAIGIHPLVVNRFLPAVLGVVTVGYCFRVAMQLLPVPVAAFLSGELLNQAIWAHQDVASGTARAFLYPLLLAVVFYYMRRAVVPCAVATALLALCYPPAGAIAAGVLMTDAVRQWWSGTRDYRFAAVGLAIGLLILGPQGLKPSHYGPVLTAAEGRSMVELGPRGDYEFFTDNWVDDWLNGDRAGMFPLFEPPLASWWFVLPLVVFFRARFRLAAGLTANWRVIIQLLAVAFALFVVAHLLLFRLYHPGRYTMHTVRIVLALTGGAATAVVLDWAIGRGRAIGLLAVTLTTIVLASYPVFFAMAAFGFPNTGFIPGQAPELYRFLRDRPKDTLVAGTSIEMENIPAFAARSVLEGRGFSLPWHTGYYRQFRERMVDVIRAQYSPDAPVLADVIHKYGIDYWLLDADAFEPWYLETTRWLWPYDPAIGEARRGVRNGQRPVVQDLVSQCSVLQTSYQRLLDANCVVARARGE